MSKWTTERRKSWPLKYFGDPVHRLFPIDDQSDVDDAAKLIGHAKNPDVVRDRIIQIAAERKLSVPESWRADGKDVTMSASFNLEPSGRRVDGKWAIYPNTLLFKAGEYPDKKFAITPEEMYFNAVENFEPVTNSNIEHTSFLSGRAAELRSTRMDDDGETLRGEVAIPLAFDDLLEDSERKVSLEWNTTSKQISGIALTTCPRIPEAALMSAFAAFRHNTPHGQMAIQAMHDHATHHGAVCKASNTAKMASAHEHSAIQQMHDIATGHGAICPTVAGAAHAPAMYSDNAAGSSGNSNAENGGKGKRMSIFEKIKTRLQKDGKTVDDEQVAEAIAEFSAQDKPVKTDETLLRRLATMEAEKLADQYILVDKKALPKDKDAIVAAFTQAAMDDLANPAIVKFSVGDKAHEVSRVDTLKALFSNRLPHVLTSETLAEALEGTEQEQVIALFNKAVTTNTDETKPMAASRKQDLMSKTPLGEAALKGDK